jgi:predicted ATPase
MRIESIKLKNFKAFQDVHIKDIPPFCVVIGANGTGKSTLFDVFRFLKHCLNSNVRKALQDRGGFHEVVSRGHDDESILIEIKFRMEIAKISRLVTYSLEIAQSDKQPFIKREILRYKRGEYGSPFHFLDFENGSGHAINNEEDFSISDKDLKKEQQKLDASYILAIKGLGQFDRFKAASGFRKLIENWHISDFHIETARGSNEIIGEDQHVSESGDNIARVARNYAENHDPIFNAIKTKMKQRVPGIASVDSKVTEDGRLLLKFGDQAFKEPFVDRYVSDGTIKMFAYLLLLNDPAPHPVLCVEEPENQLYLGLLPELAEEFESYTQRGGQVFVSTHSPDFLNAVPLKSVYWLKKQSGYTIVERAEDDPQIKSFVDSGDKMGTLWKQGSFLGVDPR